MQLKTSSTEISIVPRSLNKSGQWIELHNCDGTIKNNKMFKKDATAKMKIIVDIPRLKKHSV